MYDHDSRGFGQGSSLRMSVLPAGCDYSFHNLYFIVKVPSQLQSYIKSRTAPSWLLNDFTGHAVHDNHNH